MTESTVRLVRHRTPLSSHRIGDCGLQVEALRGLAGTPALSRATPGERQARPAPAARLGVLGPGVRQESLVHLAEVEARTEAPPTARVTPQARPPPPPGMEGPSTSMSRALSGNRTWFSCILTCNGNQSMPLGNGRLRRAAVCRIRQWAHRPAESCRHVSKPPVGWSSRRPWARKSRRRGILLEDRSTFTMPRFMSPGGGNPQRSTCSTTRTSSSSTSRARTPNSSQTAQIRL